MQLIVPTTFKSYYAVNLLLIMIPYTSLNLQLYGQGGGWKLNLSEPFTP